MYKGYSCESFHFRVSERGSFFLRSGYDPPKGRDDETGVVNKMMRSELGVRYATLRYRGVVMFRYDY
jgi:hypothetical protein